ncbi:hypothetical protein GH714_035253 [Hevea brasiliensis]|uniref:Uncharacterized protein n=1 Tax=Hevea brasiliensis TaxID=3981 RepID=A0A6A6MJS4_HEVBR|nr:hypothetical protein GH714_035253 [Hevea brasiliensis]
MDLNFEPLLDVTYKSLGTVGFDFTSQKRRRWWGRKQYQGDGSVRSKEYYQSNSGGCERHEILSSTQQGLARLHVDKGEFGSNEIAQEVIMEDSDSLAIPEKVVGLGLQALRAQ